jgi:hypothetical protein
MALSHSPQTITNGLVFYYDMGNPQKSWKGAPTTNYLIAPLAPSSWSHLRDPSFGFISDEFFTYNGILGNNIPAYRRTLTGTDFRAVRFDVPWTAHTQSNLSLPLTGSIYGRCLTPSSNTSVNINFQGTNSSGSRVDTNTSIQVSDSWTLLSDTKTLSNNGFVSLVNFGMKYYMNGDSTPRTWEFMMPQVEQQAFATSFVNGTRSNTQTILDLTNNKTVTANGLTYNSNGTFDFNSASSNHFTLDTSVDCFNKSYTIEAWVKRSAIGVTHGITGDLQFGWFNFYITSANRLFLQHGYNNPGELRSNVTGNTNILANAWYHLVGTFEVSVGMKLYVNGVQDASNSNTFAFALSGTDRGPRYYGRSDTSSFGSAANYFNGTIDNIKMYSGKALTNAEVQQNFNALRGRYGL